MSYVAAVMLASWVWGFVAFLIGTVLFDDFRAWAAR